MKNSILILLLIVTNSIAQDNRPFSFITVSGYSIRQAEVKAHNIAYMNNLKVVSYNTTSSGGSWISVVKVVPK
jgi:hypothetical protein